MATIRALSGNWSISQSFRNYFNCCLGSKGKEGAENHTYDSDHSGDEIDALDRVPNGDAGKPTYGSVHSLKSATSNKSLVSDKSHHSDKSAKSSKSQTLSSKTESSEESVSRSVKSVRSVRSNTQSASSRNSKRTQGDGAEVLEEGGEYGIREEDGQYGNTELTATEERQGIIHIVPSNSDIKKGSAYAYEEQDTSSDSDDEVLRRYQQSIQRVPSQRSLHSQRSHKSAASRASKSSHPPNSGQLSGEKPDSISLAEKGGKDGSTYSKILDDSYEDRSSSHSQGSKTHSHHSQSSKTHSHHSHSSKTHSHHGAAAVTTAAVIAAQQQDPEETGSPRASPETYENEGFQKDLENNRHLEPGSPTSTEQALSAFGDGSTSIGDASPQSPLSPQSPQEHLFDVSDLQDREPILISKCGNLEVAFEYDTAKDRMGVTVHKAVDIPSKDRGGANNTQVRLLLLPTKKIRHKTKVKQGENPEFSETFTIKVPSEELGSMGIRFRLYGCERMRRERMIGEVVVGFASLNLDMPTTHMLTLEPRSNLSHGDSKLDVSSLSRSDSASSTQSMQHGGMPELLIGLTYNGTTGRLSVEVIKGSNFKNMAMNRAPDTYVKLTLMSPNGQEIAHSKTSIRRGQPNPLYKETFMFQVALFQLPDVTLMVSVYNKRSMKRKEMIGWFSLGYSSSGEEEISHWNDMRESKGEPVCRWHVLLEA